MSYSSHRLPGKTICCCCAALLFVTQSILAATSADVKGRVFDRETKDPLPGANVLVKGTSIGASSDINGNFVIRNVPVGPQTLLVTYVGYKSISIGITLRKASNFNKMSTWSRPR